MVLIPTPSDIDILCGKDKTFNKHPGNLKYRQLIEEYAESYTNESSKQIKMKVTKHIVSHLEALGARFLRPMKGDVWEEISNQDARDKISHALRFCAGAMLSGKKAVIKKATPPPAQPSLLTLPPPPPPPTSILRGTKPGAVVIVKPGGVTVNKKEKQQPEPKKEKKQGVVVAKQAKRVSVTIQKQAKRTVVQAMRQHRRIVSNDFNSSEHPFSHQNMAALSQYHQYHPYQKLPQRPPSPITVPAVRSDLFRHFPSIATTTTPINMPGCSDFFNRFPSNNVDTIYEEYEETTIDELSEYHQEQHYQPQRPHPGSAGYERAWVDEPRQPDRVGSIFYEDTTDQITGVHDFDDLMLEPLGVVSRDEWGSLLYPE